MQVPIPSNKNIESNSDEESSLSISPINRKGSFKGRTNFLIQKLKLNDEDSDFEGFFKILNILYKYFYKKKNQKKGN